MSSVYFRKRNNKTTRKLKKQKIKNEKKKQKIKNEKKQEKTKNKKIKTKNKNKKKHKHKKTLETTNSRENMRIKISAFSSESDQETDLDETQELFYTRFPYLRKDTDFKYLRKFLQERLYKSGGVQLLNSEEAKNQRVYCWELVKSIGKEILDGKELTRISMPIGLFEPRSFLERLADSFAYAPVYLERAYGSINPIERLKNVIVFALAGLHLSLTNSKPFNPVLGETYQSSFSNGTKIFCEQTAHHPPSSNFELIGPKDKYHFFGNGIWSASFRGNKINCSQEGKCQLNFKDGTIISWNNPLVHISGVLWGDRVTNFTGKMLFKDQTNDLEAQIIFDPASLGFVKSIFFSQKLPTHSISGTIYKSSPKKKKNRKIFSKIEGSWIESISFDGDPYWDIDENLPERPIPEKNPLPSDSTLRKDRNALLKNDLQSAGEMKIMIEEKQRYNYRLRETRSFRK
ncbi:oxysterol-binding protein [Anaeramoeba flamelloides]|uniref:Oxysterol-binding protein n=1 Tax=Anaeramoeba flamelloides TaxID=1746091 RepID=A0ABQ8XD29_9EUKA|nr:oxysterol-binding protein [Anaeramoeba flamelloides]